MNLTREDRERECVFFVAVLLLLSFFFFSFAMLCDHVNRDEAPDEIESHGELAAQSRSFSTSPNFFPSFLSFLSCLKSLFFYKKKFLSPRAKYFGVDRGAI